MDPGLLASRAPGMTTFAKPSLSRIMTVSGMMTVKALRARHRSALDAVGARQQIGDVDLVRLRDQD